MPPRVLPLALAALLACAPAAWPAEAAPSPPPPPVKDSPDAAPSPAPSKAPAPGFKWSGDLRLRHESIFNDNFRPDLHRHRERIRLRFGFTYRFAEPMEVGVRVATGGQLEPTSGNVTLSNGTKLPLALDRAYLALAPTPGLRLVGGKFENPLFAPSDLVWDNDLQPDGLAETFSWKGEGALREARLHLVQLALNEWNDLASPNPRSLMLGEQLATTLQLGQGVQLKLGEAYYHYLNADQLATARLLSPLTNRLLPSQAGFRSLFRVLNLNARLELDAGRPLVALADYAHNFGALDANNGVVLGLMYGGLKQAGDWHLGYFFGVAEADATLSAFGGDDYFGTNNRFHLLDLAWQVYDPLTLRLDAYFVHAIDQALAGGRAVWRPRVRLSLAAKF